MAKHGAVRVPKDHFEDLPNYLDNGMIPVLTSNPPHHYWEKPPRRGVLPESGSDFGAYMMAEGMGARSMVFVKDQKGLYTKDPEKHSDAEFIPRMVGCTASRSLQLLGQSTMHCMLFQRHTDRGTEFFCSHADQHTICSDNHLTGASIHSRFINTLNHAFPLQIN